MSSEFDRQMVGGKDRQIVGGKDRASLDDHFFRIDVFKVALQNAFQIDLRTARRPVAGGATNNHYDTRSKQCFHYLPEILPFVEPRVAALDSRHRRIYEQLKERAIESFWMVYCDFQPMVQSASHASGIDEDRFGSILGRAILLFQPSRRTKFVTYLDKTLRESVKNLRGELFAQRLGIPSSAGRLVNQLFWILEQAAQERQKRLCNDESEAVILDFLIDHPCKFSNATMKQIADAIINERRDLSLSAVEWIEPSAPTGMGVPGPGNDCFVEWADQREYQIRELHDAFDRAQFDRVERTIVLHRLDLPYDESAYRRITSRVTLPAMQKRTRRLLVRLMAARYAQQAPQFGKFLLATPANTQTDLSQAFMYLSQQFGISPHAAVERLLNSMALSDSVYRIGIAERNRIKQYLLGEKPGSLSSASFQKLKAALIEQERVSFPCLGEPEPLGEV